MRTMSPPPYSRLQYDYMEKKKNLKYSVIGNEVNYYFGDVWTLLLDRFRFFFGVYFLDTWNISVRHFFFFIFFSNFNFFFLFILRICTTLSFPRISIVGFGRYFFCHFSLFFSFFVFFEIINWFQFLYAAIIIRPFVGGRYRRPATTRKTFVKALFTKFCAAKPITT